MGQLSKKDDVHDAVFAGTGPPQSMDHRKSGCSARGCLFFALRCSKTSVCWMSASGWQTQPGVEWMMMTVLLQRLPKNYRAKMCSQYVLLVMQRRGPCGPYECEVDREKAIGKRWSRVLFFLLSPFWVTTRKDKQDTHTLSKR